MKYFRSIDVGSDYATLVGNRMSDDRPDELIAIFTFTFYIHKPHSKCFANNKYQMKLTCIFWRQENNLVQAFRADKTNYFYSI